MWENSLEKLKILNYENEYCAKRDKRALSRIHFVFPGQNLSNQFDDYMDLCGWLCTEIFNDPNLPSGRTEDIVIALPCFL